MVARLSLLFPGQGSQTPGMGKALYAQFREAKDVFDQAGGELRDTIFNGTEEELKKTSVTQPAIFTVSCAAYAAFSARFPNLLSQTAYAAGHSLGEYSALCSARVFDFQTGLKLVEYRGLFLQDACQSSPGTMAAILGLERDQLQNLCEKVPAGEVCEMVNFNCPGQIVVAGTQGGISALLKEVGAVAGAKAVPLQVSGAFHSSLMREAGARMKKALESVALQDAQVPVVSNCDAKAGTRAQEFKDKLVRQIDHPVYWEDSIRLMIAQGVETFVEIGPGRVLSGLLKKIDRSKKALNVEDPDSLRKTLQELEKICKSQVASHK